MTPAQQNLIDFIGQRAALSTADFTREVSTWTPHVTVVVASQTRKKRQRASVATQLLQAIECLSQQALNNQLPINDQTKLLKAYCRQIRAHLTLMHIAEQNRPATQQVRDTAKRLICYFNETEPRDKTLKSLRHFTHPDTALVDSLWSNEDLKTEQNRREITPVGPGIITYTYFYNLRFSDRLGALLNRSLFQEIVSRTNSDKLRNISQIFVNNCPALSLADAREVVRSALI